MKKLLILSSLVLFVVLSFSSCRKCTDCTAYERTTNTPIQISNYCGPNKSVNQFEDDFIATYTTVATYAECE
ncbi:MAG: hypothetical protein PHT69_01610 [Bacteroidales bacterium]|nr:hypothetical protein [Bacteroidales bacterium]